MTHVRFDLRGLFESIDDERARLGMSWAAVARDVGVSTSTIRRFGDANDAEADGVLALVRWLGVAPEAFVAGNENRRSGDTLATTGAGIVRVDMSAVATAAGDDRGARGRTRTTIQHLTSVAHHADVAISSLTRLSDA